MARTPERLRSSKWSPRTSRTGRGKQPVGIRAGIGGSGSMTHGKGMSKSAGMPITPARNNSAFQIKK